MNRNNSCQKLAWDTSLRMSRADKLLHFLSWEFAYDSRRKCQEEEIKKLFLDCAIQFQDIKSHSRRFESFMLLMKGRKKNPTEK
jgi:hypothetical protein